MIVEGNQRHRGVQQSFMTGGQRAKLIYEELDVTDVKLATLIAEQISAMAWKGDSSRSAEAFAAQHDVFTSQLPAGHKHSGERAMAMFRRMRGSWADDALALLRADCERCETRRNARRSNVAEATRVCVAVPVGRITIVHRDGGHGGSLTCAPERCLQRAQA